MISREQLEIEELQERVKNLEEKITWLEKEFVDMFGGGY
jgi:hypothetical protein